jgi:hypothetical protein
MFKGGENVARALREVWMDGLGQGGDCSQCKPSMWLPHARML